MDPTRAAHCSLLRSTDLHPHLPLRTSVKRDGRQLRTIAANNMASGASDASLHPRTAVFPGSAPQESAPVAEAQVDETGELSVTKTTAGDRGLETTDELVLRKKSWACRGRFKECLSVLNLVHHDWLEQRSAEFNWWTSGLNADKNGPGSLDARLSLRPDVTAVIVDALDGLEDALYTYHKLGRSLDGPKFCTSCARNIPFII